MVKFYLYCFTGGSTHMMEKIIEKKPSLIREKNSLGNTPLHVSCLAGFVSCAKILLDKGADIYAVNKIGQTPLHIAAQLSSEEVSIIYKSVGLLRSLQNLFCEFQPH